MKGMGSPGPSTRAGGLSNKVEVQLFMKAKSLTDAWPPELRGRRRRAPAFAHRDALAASVRPQHPRSICGFLSGCAPGDGQDAEESLKEES